MNPQELINAKNLILAMPLNQVMELKEIYGESWSSISSPTTFGKKFKKEYDNESFPNLKWHGVKPNGPNHERYERIK
ncbi:hypothetical protein [Anaerosalibacter sp. Marseille-P3206]|uniref:hypothetical protein n=1 Tax=Anaerosalibacter sp. Marseille-P3206 TaxID=1871005 RepID=UPI0009855370|nr:hypothetical protein [Anaerosalibacter sp. Marseille-P3206]